MNPSGAAGEGTVAPGPAVMAVTPVEQAGEGAPAVRLAVSTAGPPLRVNKLTGVSAAKADPRAGGDEGTCCWIPASGGCSGSSNGGGAATAAGAGPRKNGDPSFCERASWSTVGGGSAVAGGEAVDGIGDGSEGGAGDGTARTDGGAVAVVSTTSDMAADELADNVGDGTSAN